MNLLAQVEDFVIALGGRKTPRLLYWNSTDDNPTLNCAHFEIVTKNGTANIEAAEKKDAVNWPDYPCVGDGIRDKFAVTFYGKGEDGKTTTVSVTNGFIPITQINLITYLTAYDEKHETFN